LVAAFSSSGKRKLPQGGDVVNRQEFIPKVFMSGENPVSLVVHPLYFRDKNYGFSIFEVGPLRGSSYHTIVEYISSALQNVMVLQEVTNRVTQLQTASDVSRAASTILDPNELIHQTVELIRDRFNLYYAGIFLIDETAEWAILRAG